MELRARLPGVIELTFSGSTLAWSYAYAVKFAVKFASDST